MKEISAQVSLYPLRQEDLLPQIRRAWEIFQESGLRVQKGSMSTVIWGETDEVFSALRDVFAEAGEQGDAVMVVTFSNACPRPEEDGQG